MAKTTSDPRLKRELATCAFKLVRAAEALSGEEEVKSPWYLSHGDARGDSMASWVLAGHRGGSRFRRNLGETRYSLYARA